MLVTWLAHFLKLFQKVRLGERSFNSPRMDVWLVDWLVGFWLVLVDWLIGLGWFWLILAGWLVEFWLVD